MLNLYCIPGILRQLTRLFVCCLGYNIRCKNSLTCQSKKENALSTKSLLCQGFQFPDITGGTNKIWRVFAYSDSFYGCLTSLASSNNWGAMEKNGAHNGCSSFGISASNSSQIYGTSTTNQPKSFYVLTIIKN